MEFIKKNTKLLSIFSNIVVIIGLFLPFATISVTVLGTSVSKSINFIEGDGIIIIIAVIIATILMLLKKKSAKIVALIALIISIVITIYDAMNVQKAFNNVETTYSDLLEKRLDIGFYLILIGLAISIGLVIYDTFILKKINVVSANINQNNNTVQQPINMNNEMINNYQLNTNNQQPINQTTICPMCGATSTGNFCGSCGNKLN